MTEKTISQILAKFVSSLNYNNLPAEIIGKTKILLLDCCGALIAGANTPQAKLITNIFSASHSCEEATIFGSWQKASKLDTAFVNAFSAHCLEVDDLHPESVIHAGAVVIPPALAIAESQGNSGKNLIEAIVAGYEVATRIGMAAGRSHYSRWHSTGTCGAFGAAAAAAKLLNLDTTGIAVALGHAGTLTSGLWEFITIGSAAKPLVPAHAAWLGVLSATLAVGRLPAPMTILEGKQGFFTAMTAESPTKVTQNLGQDYQIAKVSLKPYPCCRHIHSAIDAALQLAPKIETAEITRIKVRTFAEAIKISGLKTPATLEEAKFSLSHCLSAALVFNKLGVSQIEASLKDANVRKLESLVDIEVDPELDSLFPQFQPCFIELTTPKRNYRHRVDSPKGNPDNPLSQDEIIDKFVNLASSTFNQQQAEAIADKILQIDRAKVIDILDIMGVT